MSARVKIPNPTSKTAFTLIELLVVVAIIAVLVAILLPALNAARSSAKTTLCLTNLRQAGLVFQYYSDTYNDIIPSAVWWSNSRNTNDGHPIWPYPLRDAGLVGNGTGGNAGIPEPIALDAGTYPLGIWRCPSGGPTTKWWWNQTHYGMNGEMFHTDLDVPSRKWYKRRSKAPDPAGKVLLADSWSPDGNNQTMYLVNIGISGLSFRHRSATNLLYIDGHTVTKSAGTFDPVLLWSRFFNDFAAPEGWNN